MAGRWAPPVVIWTYIYCTAHGFWSITLSVPHTCWIVLTPPHWYSEWRALPLLLCSCKQPRNMYTTPQLHVYIMRKIRIRTIREFCCIRALCNNPRIVPTILEFIIVVCKVRIYNIYRCSSWQEKEQDAFSYYADVSKLPTMSSGAKYAHYELTDKHTPLY